MSFVDFLEDMAYVMSMNTNLKGVLGFSGVLDIECLFIVDIWHYVQKWPGSTMRSIYFQTFALSQASSDFVDLCPNIRCNHSKRKIPFSVFLFDFGFSVVFNKNACFLYAIYSSATKFFSLALKNPVKNILWKRQVCPKIHQHNTGK